MSSGYLNLRLLSVQVFLPSENAEQLTEFEGQTEKNKSCKLGSGWHDTLQKVPYMGWNSEKKISWDFVGYAFFFDPILPRVDLFSVMKDKQEKDKQHKAIK